MCSQITTCRVIVDLYIRCVTYVVLEERIDSSSYCIENSTPIAKKI